MNTLEIRNQHVRLAVSDAGAGRANRYGIAAVELCAAGQWVTIAALPAEQVFRTADECWGAQWCEVAQDKDGGWRVVLKGSGKSCRGEMVLTISEPRRHASADGSPPWRIRDMAPLIRRSQSYTFTRDSRTAVCPGWRAVEAEALRYTYPLHVYDEPLPAVPELCADVAWAMPLPFQVWHTGGWVAALGVDRTRSGGTPALQRRPDGVWFCSNLPDQTDTHPQEFGSVVSSPARADFRAGQTVTIEDVLWAALLADGDEFLTEVIRAAADILGVRETKPVDLAFVADGIADYYAHCGLWNPNAFGPGRGWFRNMWSYTQGGTPTCQDYKVFTGLYDLGWGEGIAVEMMVAAVRNWRRTRDGKLLPYVDDMTRSIPLFARGPGGDEPFFDRSDGKEFGDFNIPPLPHRIWSHSLGHIGTQLLTAYLAAPDYPSSATREMWLGVARQIGRYFCRVQKPSGDIPDVVDDQDRELHKKPRRITARAVVCGLWTMLAGIDNDPALLERARRLAQFLAPAIDSYNFYNQMIDTFSDEIYHGRELPDGEGAYYVLEGLIPLYERTRDAELLRLCRKAAAWGISWTYFFDLPLAPHGVAKGGQCCRMPDYPLLYPIGPAKGVEPLCRLAAASGDALYRDLAGVMATFIGHCRVDAPGKPWHGAMIHALEQRTGKHWGPEKLGQIDSGMATGNSLAALEYWLGNPSTKHQASNSR